MKTRKLKDIAAYQMASSFTKIFNEAVREAIKENHEYGLPNDFSIGNDNFYELPDGEITKKNPLGKPLDKIKHKSKK